MKNKIIAFSSVTLLAGTGVITQHKHSMPWESLPDCQTRVIPGGRSEGKRRGKSMFHLIWYVLIGLIAGVIAKSVMHVHMTIFWTIVLGIIDRSSRWR